MDKKALQEKLVSLEQLFDAQKKLKDDLQAQMNNVDNEMLRLAGGHRTLTDIINNFPENKISKVNKGKK